MFRNFSHNWFTLKKCYHGRLWKQFWHQWKQFFFNVKKTNLLLCIFVAHVFSVHLRISSEDHQPNTSPPNHHSGRLQKQFWQQQWKPFGSMCRRGLRFTELFLVQIFFHTSKDKNCLETATKHILLKSCKKFCVCICLKIYFLSKYYSERLLKQPWQHQWKRFCSKSRKSITFLRFFPDRLLPDRFFSNRF